MLDEADEMLRMGFIDDVEWILEQAPEQRQIALFSATMPPEVRRIAKNHLHQPQEVTIRSKTTTASKIRQRYWIVSGMHKLDALTRILEAEPFDGMLVFTRTKIATEELAERLEARGFAVEALNGDIVQAQRERTVARLKSGQIDIVVATDVAARGLDVERVSHVVNFDVPYDPESYVHRIGRTGRAGRSGEAILFIAPRERNMLRVIERATRQTIAPMDLPTLEDVNEQRVARFTQRISDAIAAGEGDGFRSLIERYESEHNVPAVEIAAALASIAQGKKPLLLDTTRAAKSTRSSEREERAEPAARESRPPRAARERARPEEFSPRERPTQSRPARPERREGSSDRSEHRDEDKETYRVEVGHAHGVKPGNIVGAIANEAGLDGRQIGRVVIRDDHSFVDLPAGMSKETLRKLQKARVAGQMLQVSRALKSRVERLQRDREDAPPKKRRPPKR